VKLTRREYLGLGAGTVAAAAMGMTGLAPQSARAITPLEGANRPRPTPAQLAWQREELSLFVHFTINTFTGREWGDGSESPQIFNPLQFDARQWARTAKECGFGSMILTAKHHDGFCLWPTSTTRHSVASSPWRGGKGDVVREFVDACREYDLGVGFYLSPWDRNAPSYGQGKAYDDFYIEQLTELLTQYGEVVEVWFDGANGEGPNGKRQTYDWPRIHATVRELQPNAVMFSDSGPDVRWIGNETGSAGSTCWSTVDPARVPHPGANDPWTNEALQQGDPYGEVWRPGETDVSIRPGWFWHAAEDHRVRSGGNLMNLYFTSVGRNSKLLLNVPPTDQGLFDDHDVNALREFARLRNDLFAHDLAQGARIAAADPYSSAAHVLDGNPDTYWSTYPNTRATTFELHFEHEIEFDLIHLREAIQLGQHIANYRIEVGHESTIPGAGPHWTPLTWGTSIGHCKLDRVPLTRASHLRLVIEHSYFSPALTRFSVHRSREG